MRLTSISTSTSGNKAQPVHLFTLHIPSFSSIIFYTPLSSALFPSPHTHSRKYDRTSKWQQQWHDQNQKTSPKRNIRSPTMFLPRRERGSRFDLPFVITRTLLTSRNSDLESYRKHVICKPLSQSIQSISTLYVYHIICVDTCICVFH